MALNDLPDFPPDTPNDNGDIAGNNIAENCLPGGLNNAFRAFASIMRRAIGNRGSDIASAGTCNIAAASTSLYCIVTGSTSITSFGTVAAGTLRIIEFSAETASLVSLAPIPRHDEKAQPEAEPFGLRPN